MSSMVCRMKLVVEQRDLCLVHRFAVFEEGKDRYDKRQAWEKGQGPGQFQGSCQVLDEGVGKRAAEVNSA